MKIAIDLTSLADNFSGIERMTLNITKNLLEISSENKFQLYFKEEIHPEFLYCKEKDWIECIVLPRKNKLWFNQVTLLRRLLKSDADLFLFMAFPAPFFFRSRGKIINTIHDMGCFDCPETMPRKMAAYFRIMNRNSVRRSWRILTISEFSKKQIRKHLKVPSEKIKVLYLGVSSNIYEYNISKWEAIKTRYQLPERYIMCLSTLEPKKNMKLLVEAYRELPEMYQDRVALVLAGRKGWKLEKLLETVEENKKGKICITGYIDEEDLPYIYHHAELFVFPSFYEGFGIPPLEAMATGRPVLASDIDVLKEVLQDRAVYFQNNDKESLKSTLIACLNGKAGQYSAEELIEYSRRFNYQKTAQRLQQIMEETDVKA